MRFSNRDRVEDYWIPVTSETTIFRDGDTQSVINHLAAYQRHDAVAAVEELKVPDVRSQHGSNHVA
jgi:hypothetical protein